MAKYTHKHDPVSFFSLELFRLCANIIAIYNLDSIVRADPQWLDVKHMLFGQVTHAANPSQGKLNPPEQQFGHPPVPISICL
jgi:hypothetical protein